MRSLWLLGCVIAFGVYVSAAVSEIARPQGLMWNKTGLPLVFPLQVKSVEGQDYYMVLTKAEDGSPALAAFVRGGEFFRVLVPPGKFEIEFAAGNQWAGEEDLFGEEETIFFAAPEPLTFEILDDSTKGGHIVDLRDVAPDGRPNVVVASMAICQGVSASRQARATPREQPALEQDPVGQEILERRFLRGANVFESYDRERQQRDLDPPVLGLPTVPLAKPDRAQGTLSIGSAQTDQKGVRIYERPCF